MVGKLCKCMISYGTARIIAVLLFVLSLTLSPVEVPSNAEASDVTGTTLVATVTAKGIFEEIDGYNWDIQKTVTPASITIQKGETKPITYTITANRQAQLPEQTTNAIGSIYVENTGETTTTNLRIQLQVQHLTETGKYADVVGASQTIVPAKQLAPGDKECYFYEPIFFNPLPLSINDYRVVAQVMISNYSGSVGIPSGPSTDAVFSLPDTPVVKTFDAIATITDALMSTNGFTISGTAGPWTSAGTWTVTDSTSTSYTLQVTNNSIDPGNVVSITNHVTLEGCDSHMTHSASATLLVSTGVPDTVPPQIDASITPPLPDGENGWYVTTPTITLTPDETATIYYNWDNQLNMSRLALPIEPVVLRVPEGQHLLGYHAVDLAGNNSAFDMKSFKVDTTTPKVASTDPVGNAVAVPRDKNIAVIFDENIQPGINLGSIILKSASGRMVAIAKSVNGNMLNITPLKSLQPRTKYIIVIPEGAIKDMAGNNFIGGYTLSFTTGQQ